MTLEQLKDAIRTISLSHIDISDFDYGEDALVSTTDKRKPYVFLELPYSINLLASKDNGLKSIQFAVLVLIAGTEDDVRNDHAAISRAEQIGDAIMHRIENTITGFRVNDINGISLREFSDDNLSGFRYDVSGWLSRLCNPDNYFSA